MTSKKDPFFLSFLLSLFFFSTNTTFVSTLLKSPLSGKTISHEISCSPWRKERRRRRNERIPKNKGENLRRLTRVRYGSKNRNLRLTTAVKVGRCRYAFPQRASSDTSMPDIHSSPFSPRFFSRLFPARSIAQQSGEEKHDRRKRETHGSRLRRDPLGGGRGDTSLKRRSRLGGLELEKEREREKVRRCTGMEARGESVSRRRRGVVSPSNRKRSPHRLSTAINSFGTQIKPSSYFPLFDRTINCQRRGVLRQCPR